MTYLSFILLLLCTTTLGDTGKFTDSTEFKDAPERYRILFLGRKQDHDLHMDRWFERTFEAALRNPRLDVVGPVWGKEWDGWNDSVSIADNVLNRYGYLDIVHVHELHDPPEKIKTAKIISGFFHEQQCYDGLHNCALHPHFKEVQTAFMSYANSMIYFLPFVEHMLVTHLPHGASIEIFYEDVGSPRDIDALLVGKVSSLYPLREKIKEYIEKKEIPGTIRAHPGYYSLEFEGNSYNSISLDHQERQYANQLKSAKIAYVTSSWRRYALRKYMEAALSGCLIIGNTPAERQEEHLQYLVEIDAGMSSKQMSDIVEYYLKNETARFEKARRGQEIAMKKYTYDVFIEGLIDGWDSFMAGKRGMDFPYETELTRPLCYPMIAPRPDCIYEM